MACAFDSIDASVLDRELAALGLPSSVRQAIKELTTESSTQIKLVAGKTEEIDMSGHFIQGSPLTPLIFNLYLARTVRALRIVFNGVLFERKQGQQALSVSAGFFADDSIAFFDTAAETECQRFLTVFAAALKELRIRVNTQKSFVIAPARVASASEQSFRIDNDVISMRSANDHVEYLGAKVVLSGDAAAQQRADEEKAREIFVGTLSVIEGCHLSMHQKMDAIRKILLPRMEAYFKHATLQDSASNTECMRLGAAYLTFLPDDQENSLRFRPVLVTGLKLADESSPLNKLISN